MESRAWTPSLDRITTSRESAKTKNENADPPLKGPVCVAPIVHADLLTAASERPYKHLRAASFASLFWRDLPSTEEELHTVEQHPSINIGIPIRQ